MGNLHLDAGTSGDERSLLNESTDNTEGIMEGTVGLFEHESVGATEEDGNSLTLVGAFENLDNFVASSGTFFNNEASSAELLLCELVNMGDGCGVDGAGNEINLVAVNVLDNHNLLFGEEMESKVGNGLAEDTLLEKEHVGARGNDFLNHIEDVALFFFQKTVHSGVIVNNYVRFEVGLGG